MDQETISAIVRESLDRAFRKLHGGSASTREWTREVKAQLCAAGQDQKLYVCAAGVKGADNPEWLYDVCWLRYGEENPPLAQLVDGFDYFDEAVLIVESEWANGGTCLGQIRDDFQKLLVGRARVRCVIWEDNEQDDRKIVCWLKSMVLRYMETAPDDFYLLARYTDDGFQYSHLYGNGTVCEPQDADNG